MTKSNILQVLAFTAFLFLGLFMPKSAYEVHIKMLIGLGILIAGGSFLVNGAKSIAFVMKISPMVVGLTIVALGTSAPELFISVQSALKGSPDMAMGNVVGSNICNLTLVLGAMLVLAPVPVSQDSIRIDWPVMMMASLLLFYMTEDKLINQFEGIVLVICIVSYVVFLIIKSKKKPSSQSGEQEEGLSIVESIILIVAGGFGLYYGSEWFVSGAELTFIGIGMDKRLVGIIVLAVGTSLPELVASIVAARNNDTQMALGGLIGSNIFNILLILGFTTIIKQVAISPEMRDFDMIWMMGIAFILLPLMIYENKLTFVSGIVLLLIYAAYVGILVSTVMYGSSIPLPLSLK